MNDTMSWKLGLQDFEIYTLVLHTTACLQIQYKQYQYTVYWLAMLGQNLTVMTTVAIHTWVPLMLTSAKQPQTA
jgi:hypothetical protein